ncbi:MAG: hypothetical protein AAFO89_07215 [Planctomycetota bacterium]
MRNRVVNTRRRGFSALDLLAATAAVGVAAAVAQPVLNGGRQTAQAMTNTSQHRLLSSQQAMFIMANDGAFTGPTTSGWPGQNGMPIDGDRFVGNTSSTTPVQQQDWITPLVGDLFNFSPNRALRTQQLFETIRDPRQGRNVDLLFNGSNPADVADFENVLDTGGGFRAPSYLAPATFQFWGTPQGGGFIPGKGTQPSDIQDWINKFGGVPYNFSGAIASTIKTPRGYLPRIDQVGTSPANKVQFADGTRYLESNGLLDITVNPSPSPFGNHVSGFFGWEGSVAYGRMGPGSPDNIRLSARRAGLRDTSLGGRIMYVTFFDGSTRPVTLSTAKSRIDWWAPTGSEWVSTDNIAPELDGLVQPGDLIP